MLGEMTVQGTSQAESSMNSNSNPGTRSRPKSAHVLSQLCLPAHPSNLQWTVTPQNFPGTTHIPGSVTFFFLAYTDSPFYPLASLLFLLPFTVTCHVLCRAEWLRQRGNKQGGHWWHFYPSSKENNKCLDNLFGTHRCQSHPSVCGNHWVLSGNISLYATLSQKRNNSF